MTGSYNTIDYTPTHRKVMGIDLFTERINGIRQTTIYQRYEPLSCEKPARVFARSVNPNGDAHDEIVESWKRRGDVRDFRPSAVRTIDNAETLLSGAIGAVKAIADGDTSAAYIARVLDETLSDAERDVISSTLT